MDPIAACILDLQTATIVLAEDREDPEVRMRSDAELVIPHLRRLRGIIDERGARQRPVRTAQEKVGRQPKTKGETPHQVMRDLVRGPEIGHCVGFQIG